VAQHGREVHCERHGRQQATFVCCHIVRGLREGVSYGFYWADDPDNPRPDAWCTACNELVASTGGEWTDESEAFAQVTLLCGACYDRARAMNLGA
jgi:hypothetical protein